MSKIQYIKYESPNAKKKTQVPLTMEWKNERFVRIHSIRAASREIIGLSSGLDLVKINIIGNQSSGKSELSYTLAHLIHTLSDIPYTVKIFTKDDLLDFENTMSKLQPQNHILVFDDVSYLKAISSAGHVNRVERAMTEIRHLPGGVDVKIIIILNFHYNYAVSKHLRQADFFFYTSIGSSERENTLGVVGKKYGYAIDNFRNIYKQATVGKQFKFILGKKGQNFVYEWRKPFAPVFFWNENTARIVVFPLRTWIDPVCGMCANARGNATKEIMDIKAFDEDVKHRFGIGVIRQGLRIKLFNMGVNTYQARVKQFMRYVEEYMSNKNCNAEQLAEFYDLRDVKTVLREDVKHLRDSHPEKIISP